ncbi:hypothetical protein HOU02_gp367 [Caulobacter phage CcrBL9]|uniref:Uncharacterized protein n=1 Tax=Caulobacter phage CcrBL9 TaxID=2283270 RepID=A0A385EF10_9CAUD|nr:hypothetical protein HOU02_gp367 [Caulobacter phage CcrBL9]AXQ69358.1 hypothetical protein CcrBL9_gp334 [Caulobacter phage CcrBL9]
MAKAENVSVVLIIYKLYETDSAVAVNAGELQMQRDNPRGLAYLPKSQIIVGKPLAGHEDKVRSRGVPMKVAERLGISLTGYYAVFASGGEVTSRVEWCPVTMPKWLADKNGWTHQSAEDMVAVCKTWAYTDITVQQALEAIASPGDLALARKAAREAKDPTQERLGKALDSLMNLPATEPVAWEAKETGYYWIALNDHIDFYPVGKARPFLVKVEVEEAYAMVTSVDGRLHFEFDMTVKDRPRNQYKIAFSGNIAGAIPTTTWEWLGVTWISEVHPPAMPKELALCE